MASRICIITSEFVGPHRNGGIGTAYTNLALLLAGAGHEVTVAYVGIQEGGPEAARQWRAHYAARGINFIVANLELGVKLANTPWSRAVSYKIYLWLQQQAAAFDVVHVADCGGLGYHCLLAKRLGLDFEHTRFIVGMHGPTLWAMQANRDLVAWRDQLDVFFLEAESVRMADLLVSPSRYILEWAQGEGWELPERQLVLTNAISPRPGRHAALAAATIEEIVFFGRLEERKGLGLFCDALDRLLPRLMHPPRITFLGKPVMVRGLPGDEFVAARAAAWGQPITILTDKDRDGALAYLAGPGRLAVIPSLAENSPYTVLECLAEGVPFQAAAVGGIAELIAEEDRARTCFTPDPPALARSLAEALRAPPQPPRSAVDFEVASRTWLELHAQPHAQTTVRPRPAPPSPLVSVCLVHHDRPTILAQAVRSLEAQSYDRFEVVLVDDGSPSPEAQAYLDRLEPTFSRRGWRIVRQENRYLGAARNHAARLARGEYLLFMDDDNVACPDEIATFVRCALASGADVLTCAQWFFHGDAPPNTSAPPEWMWLPIGGNAALGVFENCFGDANALIRREAFEELGGFTEDWGVGHEDWEFFARAVLKGYRVQSVPEPLIWYRVNEAGMLRKGHLGADYARSLRSYTAEVPIHLRNVIRFAQGLYLSSQNPGHGTASPVDHRLVAEVEGKRWLEEQFWRKDEQLESIKRSFAWRVVKPIRFVEKRLRRRAGTNGSGAEGDLP